MPATKILNEKVFDYERFGADVRDWCKNHAKTLSSVSVDVLFRNETYLSGALNKKALPPNVAVAIAKMIGVELKDYKVKKEKKEANPAAEVKKTVVEEDAKGWSCFLKVDEDIGVAMVKIFKDGQEIAVGRSYTYGGDNQGILQGISYAAHMCYKMVQQGNMAHAIMQEEGVGTEEDEDANPSARVIFKDWIKKYECENSKAGTLARYVKSHYVKIPATGKKKIRSFLRLNNGDAHLLTFDTLWDQYFKWCEANAVENNSRLGIA